MSEITMDEFDRPEFVGQIIDLFEDYLTKKGIARQDKGFIVGKDYDELSKDITGLMEHWGVFIDPIEDDLIK